MTDLITNPYSFDAYKVDRDRNGRGLVRARIMKAGRLKYTTPDGNVFYGNISENELEKAVPTAKIKPVTIKHPPSLVTPADVKDYQEGISADDFKIEDFDGEKWLVGPVILSTEKAIKTAEDGKLGVSAGYFRDAVPTGVDGEYDFKNIDINHIAIGCDNPRAEGASISLDEAEQDSARVYVFSEEINSAQQQTPKKVSVMKQKLNAVRVGAFSLDEAQIEYDDEQSVRAVEVLTNREASLVEALVLAQTSMDEAEEEHKKAVGELTGENKGLKTRVETLEAEQEKMVSLDDVDAIAKDRADVQAELDQRGIKEEFKTILDGKKLVVTHDFPNQSFDDSEIEGAYKTRSVDKKDLDEQRKSQEALEKLKKESMDETPRYRSFSELKAVKQAKEVANG